VGARIPLLLLRGDSGIGKSALLAEAQVRTNDALAPEPVEAFASDGAVQQAILDSLGSALVTLLSEEPWRESRPLVLDCLRRLVSKGASEAGAIAAQVVLGRLRERLGDRTVELLGEVWEEARAASSDALANRIADARDPGFTSIITELSSELLSISGRTYFIMALDRVELLPEGDVRLLADTARRLPEGVLIRAAVLDTSPRGADIVSLLRTAGDGAISVIEVRPLDEAGVRAMLADADLDQALAPGLLRLTGGYPLHLGDAVLHLQRGGGVHNLPPDLDFGIIIEQGWAAVDSPVRQIARQLCLLDQPPPLGALRQITGLSDAEWWDAADRLRAIRVFTQVVDETPWFHEHRRRLLISRLTTTERRSSAARLVPVLIKLLSEPTGWRYSTTIGDLICDAGPAIEDVGLRNIAFLDDSELAVAGALLELYEPSRPALDAQEVLQHARHHFPVVTDTVAALDRLSSLGLVAVSANDWVAAAVPILTIATAAAIAGRCQRQFGRTPVLGLASAIWATRLAPLAAPFEIAIYGIGSPRPGVLAHDAHMAAVRSSGRIGRGFQGCIAFGEHRATPVYAVATTMPDQVTRLSGAWRDAEVELAGGTFAIGDILEYPAPRLRTQRWALAADDLLGKAPFGEDAGLELEVELELISRAREAIRERMTRTEQLATGLTTSMHYFFWEKDGRRVLLQVRGMTSGVTRIDEPARWTHNDPYRFLRLAEAIGLPREASISHVTMGGRGDRKHPFRKLGSDLAATIGEYNREQPRVSLDLTPGRLEGWLEVLLDDRHKDASLLHAALQDSSSAPPRLHVFLVTSPVPRNSSIDVPPASVAIQPAAACRVDYALMEDPIQGWGRDELTERFPETRELDWRGYAAVDDAITDLTGYHRDDVSSFRSVEQLGLRRPRP
jgi:hypothetical protein